MRSIGAFVLAVAVGGAIALSPSCGTGGTCSPSTCSGCCANGKCYPGTDNSTCGGQGAVCATCSSAETCSGGICTTGSGNCGASCQGCCAPNGACISPANTAAACGQGGAACQICSSGQLCAAGHCSGGTCSGCLDATGTCQAGTSNAQCGLGGNACVACTGSQMCMGQECVTPGCTGCVNGSGCQPGTSNAACGSGGGACAACTGAAVCTNQQCIDSSCNGCVDGTGTCQTGTSAADCGKGGVTCGTCAAPSSCSTGTCTAPPSDGGTITAISCASPDTYNTSNGGSCGSWRWNVKTGQDSAAPAILTQMPTPATIQALGQLPVPSGLGSSLPRTAQENTLYILKNITVVETKLESDSDYHLPIKDSATNATMEAEISFPPCTKNIESNGPFYCYLTHSRNTLEKIITPTGSYQSINQTATIIGPAFFDMLHGSASAAPNGIEIHPILAICFGQDCDPLAN